jgi:hypothetical protein
MNEILQKINTVCSELNSTKMFGEIVFLGIIERDNLDDAWDIVVGGSRVVRENRMSDMAKMIDLLRRVLDNDLSFVAQIVLLESDQEFILDVGLYLERNNISTGEVRDARLLSTRNKIKRMYVIKNNFDKNVLDQFEKETRAQIELRKNAVVDSTPAF